MSNSLDNLAAHGVIDFDADSYVKGRPPRYVGDPDGYVGLPFERPLPAANEFGVIPGPRLHGEPAHDAFVSKKHGQKESMDWKGFLFGALLATLGAVGATKLYKKVSNWKSARAAKAQTPPTPAPVATTTTAATNTAVTTTTTSNASNAKKSLWQKTKDTFKSMKSSFAKWPKWAKYSTYSAATLGGLYVLYKMFGGGTSHSAGPGPSGH